MLKQILAAVMALLAVAAVAAVDVNKASRAELESVKGIGPTLAGNIIDERKMKGAFKHWQDMVDRVKGVGEGNAAKFSAEGLTVNGAAFAGAPAKPAAMSADDKKAPAKKDKEDQKSAKAEAAEGGKPAEAEKAAAGKGVKPNAAAAPASAVAKK